MTLREAEPFQDLANAILIQAAKDYRFYRKRLQRHPDDTWTESQIRELERFFKSSWADLLVGDMDADYILRKLKEEE